jgi:uncharacterized cupin superfamily protein
MSLVVSQAVATSTDLKGLHLELSSLQDKGFRPGAGPGECKASSTLFSGASGVKTGLWRCEPGCFDVCNRANTESVLILAGKIRLTDLKKAEEGVTLKKGEASKTAGASWTVGAGNIAVLELGSSVRWEILETCVKLFVIADKRGGAEEASGPALVASQTNTKDEPRAKRLKKSAAESTTGASDEDEEGDFANEEDECADEDENKDEDEEDGDWKATLFYWRGGLQLHPATKKLSWRGAWVGSTKGLPSEASFSSSENTFELSANLPKKMLMPTLSSVATEFAPKAGISARFTGSYLLDQGDGNGPQKYSDISQSFLIFVRGTGVQVAAKGTTEFGSFVSAGKLSPGDQKQSDSAGEAGVQLTLVRRYLDDGDARSKWSAKKAADELKKEGGRAAVEPWKSKSMRLRFA